VPALPARQVDLPAPDMFPWLVASAEAGYAAGEGEALELLDAQEGKLFEPLAFTKTWAMIAAPFLSITPVPVLITLLVRSRIRPETDDPVNRAATGRYIDVDIRRADAARYGLNIADVQEVVETAVGGMTLAYTVAGLERCPISLRWSGQYEYWERRGQEAKEAGRPLAEADARESVVEGALLRLRPQLMTVLTIMVGLLPIMWGSGTGSEVMRRIAAPMVGGMVSATLLTPVMIPSVFLLWKRRDLRRT